MRSNKINNLKRTIFSCLLYGLATLSMSVGTSIAQPILASMGDSIGEGVQSGDAAWQTQVFSYLSWVNFQMGADLTLPFIQTNLFGIVGNTTDRFRIFPDTINTNVAVSGATVSSLLNDRANALATVNIDSEADLVLFPRQQSQIEYIESDPPQMVICWIGNNDVLSAAISFGNMNASQLTSVASFESNYISLVDRLDTLIKNNGTKVIFANIPDVTDIGFLVDRAAAESLTGFPVALPDGQFTSIVGVLLMKFFGNDDLVNDPNFVLDSTEIAIILDRVQAFNTIIKREATRIGMPVVDVNAKFSDMVVNPPVFGGFPLSQNMLGGLFSLDGIHPSNIGHALVANEFIKTMNQAFGMTVPELGPELLTVLFLLDPSIDKDGDGKATGRLGVGLVETLAFLFGLTGDTDDTVPN